MSKNRKVSKKLCAMVHKSGFKYLTAFFVAFVICNTIYGQTWTTVGVAGFSTSSVYYCNMAIDGSGTPYVVYSDGGTALDAATVMKYDGTSWVTVGSAGFSGTSVLYTSIAIDTGGTPYVAYTGGTPGTVSVVKYNGVGWANVGPGLPGTSGEFTSIAIDRNGIPYVVYKDFNNGNRATVEKYNGTNWVPVGSAGFSAGTVSYCSIAIDNSGAPYVTYEDFANGGKATVMKYNGSNWIALGGAGFSGGGAWFTSIAVDGSGAPYVVYNDSLNSNKATVMKYNGSSWVAVGAVAFTSGFAWYTSIGIDASGIPYIGYQSGSCGVHNASVMKFNGSSWVTVGSACFSAGQADYTSIAIGPYGIPYMVYEDEGTSNKATVKKLVTPLFPIGGTETLCVGSTTNLTDATPGGTWNSSNVAVATVGSTGIVSGITVGTATISYSQFGSSTTAVVTVATLPAAGTITASVDSVCPGDTTTLSNAVTGGTWNSVNSSIATIGSTGLVTGVISGSVMIQYITTNLCGSDTANYNLKVGHCNAGVKNIGYSAATSMYIYPDPSHGYFTMNLSTPVKEDAKIIITNMMGEQVKELTISTNSEIQIQLDAPPGIYYVTGFTKEGRHSAKLTLW